MRQFAVASLVVAVATAFPCAAAAQDDQEQLQKLMERLDTLTEKVAELQAENDALRQALMEQHAGNGQAQVAQPQTVYPTQPLFQDDSQLHFYSRPGAAPPSWIDTLIQRNRQQALEEWTKRRANERLVDERLAEISAESRQIGVAFAPRPLREAVLAGGDPVEERDQLVEARDEDFKELFESPTVREYLNTKQQRLEGKMQGKAYRVGGTGSIAPANVHHLANRLRTDFQDTVILFGAGGLHGPTPGGLNMGAELTRQRRDSPNVLVSGPTRDAIAAERRMAAVEAAIVADADIEMVLRHQSVMAAHRHLAMRRAAPGTAQDLMSVREVLNGKVRRTAVPHVHAAPAPQPNN